MPRPQVDYDASTYDGEEWADGHCYGVWRPPVIRGKAGRVPEEDRVVSSAPACLTSQPQNDQLSDGSLFDFDEVRHWRETVARARG